MRALLVIAIAAVQVTAPATAHAAGVRVRFLHSLSDWTGVVPVRASQLSYDPSEGELYVISAGRVNVFDENGMSVYAFTADTEEGAPTSRVFDVAPAGGGQLFTLNANAQGWAVLRCNYRGEPVSRVEFSRLPEGFAASGLRVHGRRIYLLDKRAMTLVIASSEGKVQKVVDLGDAFGWDDKQRGNSLSGFDVSPDGSVLVTSAPSFKACVLPADGNGSCFGRSGSAPGRFGIVTGITADEDGNLFISDVLRGVVMVFDRGFKFLGEFGSSAAPDATGSLKPREIVVANGRLFVANMRGGVKVFGVEVD